MKRRLFNILAAVSLLLCVATIVLWMRSYLVADMLQLQYTHRDKSALDDTYFVSIECNLAEVSATYIRLGETPGFRHESLSLRWYHAPARTIGSVIGSLFIFKAEVLPVGYPRAVVEFPMWVPTTATPILPVLWFRRWRRLRFEKRRGLCLTCGYDLRASKERCPECGTPIPVQTPNSAKA